MSVQIDNSDIQAKKLVRRWLIDRMGALETMAVLELFAGEGHMFDACYAGCARHMAFDKRRIERDGWLMGNNRQLIQRHAEGWDIYDGDAYDNPWIILGDVCRLREPGRFGLLATCGLGRGLKNGKTNGFIRQVTGTKGLSDTRLLFRWYDDVIRMVFARWQTYGCTVQSVMRVRNKKNPDVWYYALLVEKSCK